jgi:hypothetical protein
MIFIIHDQGAISMYQGATSKDAMLKDLDVHLQ